MGPGTRGVVRDCRSWGDRKWQQVLGVTKEEVLRDCPLWAWNGDDIHVWGYDEKTEDVVKALRARASAAGKRSGEVRKAKAENEQEPGTETTNRSVQPNGSTERFNGVVQRTGFNKRAQKTNRAVERGDEMRGDERGGVGGRPAPKANQSPQTESQTLSLACGGPMPRNEKPIVEILEDHDGWQVWLNTEGRVRKRHSGIIVDRGTLDEYRQWQEQVAACP